MDKFIIGENPLRNVNDKWIIHLLFPVTVIQITKRFADIKGATDPALHFLEFINKRTSELEKWTLSIFSTDQQADDEMKQHILDRAGRWYRSILESNDQKKIEGKITVLKELLDHSLETEIETLEGSGILRVVATYRIEDAIKSLEKQIN